MNNARKTKKSRGRRRLTPKQVAAPRPLYVLSDSTGNLARHMLSAFQTQFAPEALSIRVEPFVRTAGKLKEILARAKEENAAVCHAMVSEKFKKTISQFCAAGKIQCCDLTGGIMRFLSEVVGSKPRCDLQSLHRIDEAYRRRIGAIEYTISHDDGLGLGTLHEADAVLVGVSRTSKTPTSIYLAQQGYRIANVSLALGIKPPDELLALSPEKVIGLYINPEQLVMIRHRRQETFGVKGLNYGKSEQIEQEIAWTRRLFASRGWKTLDVTDQAIEETACRVLEYVALAPASVYGDLQEE